MHKKRKKGCHLKKGIKSATDQNISQVCFSKKDFTMNVVITSKVFLSFVGVQIFQGKQLNRFLHAYCGVNCGKC